MAMTYRQRFNEEQKILLVSLVEQRIDVIESKRNDTQAVWSKHAAWELVAQEYNSHPNVSKATAKQLRKYWQNCKYKAKDEEQKKKNELQATEVGPSTKADCSISDKICRMLRERVEPADNSFDSDVPLPPEIVSHDEHVLLECVPTELDLTGKSTANAENSVPSVTAHKKIKQSTHQMPRKEKVIELEDFILQTHKREHELRCENFKLKSLYIEEKRQYLKEKHLHLREKRQNAEEHNEKMDSCRHEPCSRKRGRSQILTSTNQESTLESPKKRRLPSKMGKGLFRKKAATIPPPETSSDEETLDVQYDDKSDCSDGGSLSEFLAFQLTDPMLHTGTQT